MKFEVGKKYIIDDNLVPNHRKNDNSGIIIEIIRNYGTQVYFKALRHKTPKFDNFYIDSEFASWLVEYPEELFNIY